MSVYIDAFTRKDNRSAYDLASLELRAATSYSDLVTYHQAMTDKLGALKTVKQTYWHVEANNGITA